MPNWKRLAALLLAAVLLLPPAAVRAAGPEVEAPSAILIDAATGTVLCEQNAHAPMAPASVTKVMTMLLIMEAIDGGQLSLTDQVTASANAAAKGGSQVYLKENEVMTVDEMLKSVAVSSANDCACALAEHLCGSEAAFVERMNARAAELGMQDTHFVNCTGLDDEPDAAQHLTTAYDIALMSRELLKHDTIRNYTTIWMDSVRDGQFGLSNTNKLVRFYSGCTGLKTGYTKAAGYCLSASAKRDGMELIAVVLGCETSPQRFGAAKALLDYGFATYANLTPDAGALPPVAVRLGAQESCPVRLAEQGAVLVEKQQAAGATTEITLAESVEAPVEAGQQLGTLRIVSGGAAIAEIPIVAEQAVPRLTTGQLFLRVLRAVCFG